MSFLAPLWLGVAGAAAAALVALHFFARQRPRPLALPTARFVPDVPARAPSLSRTPSDLLRLLLRLLVVLATGVALARPVAAPARRPLVRIIAVDRSRAAVSDSAAMDSARAFAVPGDTIVGGWKSGRVGATSPTLPLSDSPTLSSLLIQAIRTASHFRERADSLELVIVSPFVEESFDAATDSIRALWPGRARLVRVAAREQPPASRITITGPGTRGPGSGEDPLLAVVELLGRRGGSETRIERGTLTAADSAFARTGGTLVYWPRNLAGAPADTVGAVAANGVVVVATFARRLGGVAAGRAVAQWVDGRPAATEVTSGTGCVRKVDIPVPEIGDLVLRRSMRDLVDVLAAPCGGPRRFAPATDRQLASLRRTGPLVAARGVMPAPRRSSNASAWLLGMAALLLIAETVLRPKATAGSADRRIDAS